MATSLHHQSARILCGLAVCISAIGAYAVSMRPRDPGVVSATSLPSSMVSARPTTLSDPTAPDPNQSSTRRSGSPSIPSERKPAPTVPFSYGPVGSVPSQADPPVVDRTTEVSVARPLNGVALCVHHVDDVQLYLDSIDTIHELGANSLEIVTPMFQYRVDSSDIRFLTHRCPTRRQLSAMLLHAEAKGMHTTLVPIVLIEQRGRGDWRGVIEPKNWDAWWTSYRAFISYYTEIAVECGVDLLSVGSELNTTHTKVERWKSIVDMVRATFDGQLMYSANWDRYAGVEFWSMLDVISVSSYFTLGEEPGLPLDELVAAWRVHRNRMLEFARDRNQPLVLSEVGYPSLDWANTKPWDYIAPKDTYANHDLQARCFESFFRSWAPQFMNGSSPAVGYYIYHWDPYNHGGPSDVRYGIGGKPARAVIERYFAEIDAATRDNTSESPGESGAGG